MTRSRVRLAIVALVALSLGAGPFGVPASASITKPVKMLGCIGANPRFQPKTITIHKGDSIKWKNPTSSCHHTATSGGWSSGDVGPGGIFVRKFKKVGTFKYHCQYHQADGMVGKVVVRA